MDLSWMWLTEDEILITFKGQTLRCEREVDKIQIKTINTWVRPWIFTGKYFSMNLMWFNCSPLSPFPWSMKLRNTHVAILAAMFLWSVRLDNVSTEVLSNLPLRSPFQFSRKSKHAKMTYTYHEPMLKPPKNPSSTCAVPIMTFIQGTKSFHIQAFTSWHARQLDGHHGIHQEPGAPTISERQNL